MSLFIRLLEAEDKERNLRDTLAQLAEGQYPNNVYTPDTDSFAKVPGSPFAYWVSDRIRNLFTDLEPFDNGARTAKQGLATAGDPRFVRLWTEVLPQNTLDAQNGPDWQSGTSFQKWCRERTMQKTWVNFAKGGAYSPYYADLHLVVNWSQNGVEVKNRIRPETGKTYSNVSMLAKTERDCFFRPGLTWSLRSQKGLSMRNYQAGSLFGHKGPVGFDSSILLKADLGCMNASSYLSLIALQMAFGSYEVGVINRTPIPNLKEQNLSQLENNVKTIIRIKQSRDTFNELSHLFVRPVLAQSSLNSISVATAAWNSELQQQEEAIAAAQAEIDEEVYSLYGISAADRQAIEQGFGSTGAEPDSDDDDEEEIQAPQHDAKSLCFHLMSWLVGVAFGRWNVDYATGQQAAPDLPDPFAPLPVCSPGMLQDEQGLTLPSPNPILIDEPGHKDDLLTKIEDTMNLLWGEHAGFIEQEACQILGVQQLRDYFSNPNQFFAKHLKMYSMSRRIAPIYWPLSTPSGAFTLWVYYPALSKETLYTAINNFVDPRLVHLQHQINTLKATAEPNKSERSELESLETQESELQNYRSELLRLTQLPYQPHLDDGVQVTASPLWRFFQYKTWQDKLKETWEQCEAGEYNWAHLAYAIWPQRISKKAAEDKSLAIAHQLTLPEVGA